MAKVALALVVSCVYTVLPVLAVFYPPLDKKLPVFYLSTTFFTKFYYHDNLHFYHVFYWLHTVTALGGQTSWTPVVVDARYDSFAKQLERVVCWSMSLSTGTGTTTPVLVAVQLIGWSSP